MASFYIHASDTEVHKHPTDRSEAWYLVFELPSQCSCSSLPSSIENRFTCFEQYQYDLIVCKLKNQTQEFYLKWLWCVTLNARRIGAMDIFFMVAKLSKPATKFVVPLHLGFETASTWPRRVRPSLTQAACNGWSASCRINLSNIHASAFVVIKTRVPRSVCHSEPCWHTHTKPSSSNSLFQDGFVLYTCTDTEVPKQLTQSSEARYWIFCSPSPCSYL